MYKFLLLFVLLSAAICDDCVRLNFLPMPKNVKCNSDVTKQRIFQDPCRILYHVKTPSQETAHFQELIKDQNHKTFNCKITNLIFGDITNLQLVGFEYTFTIDVKDHQLKSAFTTKDQAYKLNITQQNASLQANTYVGFVRGLQTFLQTFQCPKYKYKRCAQKRLPIYIEDQPAFVYRGVMVDTSRHFLPTHLLFQTVDALMYNKMNVFHWHITDQDAFPLILDAHPQIAQYGAFSPQQTYTAKQARQIVRYAMVRGVRVIPELDTPGHAASWGLAPQNQGVSCTFGTGYMGPLDVTLQKTYKLVRQVFAQIIDIFPDPIIHLGGDQVVLTCLANKTQFVKAEGVKQQQIERHYRRKQHKIIKEINKDKIPMYWFNGNIEVQNGDIVHWWGGGMPHTKNPVVISNYGPFYLDMGVGNYYAVSYGQYVTWLDLYNQNIDRMISNYDNRANVLGAEVTLWSQINNRYTHHMKIWIRSSSIAQRLWNVQNFNAKPDFFGRITAFQRLMNRRGIPTAPGTCQQCESHPQFC